MKLFKYYSLNKYTLDSLQKNSLYFNLKSNFNDPFDLKLDFKMDKDDLKRKMPELSELINLMDDNEYEKICYWNERFSFENIGIFCCTKTPNNILMWSHYADNHKGICVEFVDNFIDILKDSCKNEYADIYNRDIQYDDKRKNFNEMIQEKDSNPLYQKAECWKYEQEHRIFIRSKSINFPGNIILNENYLKNIYIGCNTSVKDFLNLEKAMGYKLKCDTTVFMSLDENEFKLKEKMLNTDEFKNLICNLHEFTKKDFYCKTLKKYINLFSNKKFEKDYRDKFLKLKISDFITYYDDFYKLHIDSNFLASKNLSKVSFALFLNNFS